MARLSVPLAIATVILAGCGGGSLLEPERGHLKVVRDGSRAPQKGTVAVAAVIAPDDSLAAQGRAPTAARGEVLLSATLPAIGHNAYTLTSFQRPCGSECSAANPGAGSCNAEFGLRDRQELTAIVRPARGQHCEIKLRK